MGLLSLTCEGPVAVCACFARKLQHAATDNGY